MSTAQCLDEFEHTPLTEKQLNHFNEEIKIYDFRGIKPDGEALFRYERHYGSCPVTVSVYPACITFSIPYWDGNEEAIFESGMIAFEINGPDQIFAIENPQAGGWQ